jgi:hypothetical protein
MFRPFFLRPLAAFGRLVIAGRKKNPGPDWGMDPEKVRGIARPDPTQAHAPHQRPENE